MFDFLLANAIIVFGYLIIAPLFVEGPWHLIKGVYAAIFFKTDQFEWANGTVIVISVLYACYALTSVLSQQKTWIKYCFLSDAATILALVYISRDVYQIMLMMIAVTPWWIVHRWVGRFVFKESCARARIKV